MGLKLRLHAYVLWQLAGAETRQEDDVSESWNGGHCDARVCTLAIGRSRTGRRVDAVRTMCFLLLLSPPLLLSPLASLASLCGRRKLWDVLGKNLGPASSDLCRSVDAHFFSACLHMPIASGRIADAHRHRPAQANSQCTSIRRCRIPPVLSRTSPPSRSPQLHRRRPRRPRLRTSSPMQAAIPLILWA